MKEEERFNNSDCLFEIDQHIHTDSDGNDFSLIDNFWNVEDIGVCSNFNYDTVLDDSSKMGQFINLVERLKITFPKTISGLKVFHLSREEVELLKAMDQVHSFYDAVCEKLTFHPYVDAVMNLSPKILEDLSHAAGKLRVVHNHHQFCLPVRRCRIDVRAANGDFFCIAHQQFRR